MAACKLDSKTARLKLPVRKQAYVRSLQTGVALLYYRGERRGSWSTRVFTGKATAGSPYREVAIGLADDFEDANEKTILSYNQAVTRALEKAFAIATGLKSAGPYTVRQAVDDYLAWAEAHRKSHHDIKGRLERHVIPAFGARRVSALTHTELEEWHRKLAKRGRFDRPKKHPIGERKRREITDPRARKVSANRELSYLKAVLNRAYRLGHVKSSEGWQRVHGFEDVERPRVQFLSTGEAERLLKSCPDEDFRTLVQGALLTGCRYGELSRLRVLDCDAERGSIFIEKAKAGRARHVPLSPEGVALFDALTTGKLRTDAVFVKANGHPWGQSDNVPRMKAACARAKLPGFTFHQLRHTYASQLAMAGVSMKVIAENLGHYDTAITEKHYAHLTDDVRREAVKKLPSFGIKIDKKIRAIR